MFAFNVIFASITVNKIARCQTKRNTHNLSIIDICERTRHTVIVVCKLHQNHHNMGINLTAIRTHLIIIIYDEI